MSCLPSLNGDYLEKEYWEERYRQEEEYEWCKDYEVIKPLIHKFVKTAHSILMIGCGNSQLSTNMYNDGFHNITNVDFSSVVIEKMSSKFPKMHWIEMDMCNLTLPASSFDVVIEKATLDVLLVKEKSPWTVSQEASDNMHKTLSGISRVLKSNGNFLSITFAQPHFRNQFYKKYWSNCKYETFGSGFHYYFYVNNNNDNEIDH